VATTAFDTFFRSALNFSTCSCFLALVTAIFGSSKFDREHPLA
jgi:hypothetical protein